jgi:hypothetical protein
MNVEKIEKLLVMAYNDMTSDNFDHDFVSGCIAEALARVQGDTGSFDIMED